MKGVYSLDKRIASLISLVFISLLGVWFLVQSQDFREGSAGSIGAGYFPTILVVLLIGLCIVSAIKTLINEKKESVNIPNLSYLLVTIGLTILLLISWSIFGLYYINGFFYIVILLSLFRMSKKWSMKILISNIFIAVGFMGFSYLLFGVIMNVRF
jgi:hypothetical protein